MDLPEYFNRDLVRLDELGGWLRQNVPEDVREPDGAWVYMRRYLPKAFTKQVEREFRDVLRQYPPVDGQNTEDYFAAAEAVTYRDIIARVAEWSYVEPIEVASLDLIPGNHTDAMIAAVRELKSPVNDEVALKQAREADKSVPHQSSGSTSAKLNGVGSAGASALDETAPLVVGGSALA